MNTLTVRGILVVLCLFCTLWFGYLTEQSSGWARWELQMLSVGHGLYGVYNAMKILEIKVRKHFNQK